MLIRTVFYEQMVFNYYNQLGYDVDDYTDDFIKITENVKDVKISNYTVILLKNDGTLIGMGQNVYGELGFEGLGTEYSQREIIAPVKLELKNVQKQ